MALKGSRRHYTQPRTMGGIMFPEASPGALLSCSREHLREHDFHVPGTISGNTISDVLGSPSRNLGPCASPKMHSGKTGGAFLPLGRWGPPKGHHISNRKSGGAFLHLGRPRCTDLEWLLTICAPHHFMTQGSRHNHTSKPGTTQ